MDTLLNTALTFGHTALSFILIISVIVFIHEFGHYLAARLCGVKIDAFAIGFGKELFGWTDRTGTRWKVCLLPMGGYVKMYGDATEASTPDMEQLDTMTDAEKRISFHYKALWQKAIIVAAGPFANFLLAIVIFTSLIMTNGLDTTEPVVGAVVEGSVAEAVGIQPKDRVLSVDGKAIHTFNQIPQAIAANLGEEVILLIEREGEKVTVRLTPRIEEYKDALGTTSKRPLIGIQSHKITSNDVNLPQAVWESTKKTYQMIDMSLEFIGQMVSGQRSADELKGPIGIAELSGKATQQDFWTIIWFMALLSVNLGFVNILPIPPLDGGHLLFYALEGARGRPLAEKFQEWGYKVGFGLILCLMAFSIFNDFRNIVFG
jgi:regulator of sigma E protease